MSSEVVINVDGLGKVFPIYAKPHHRLLQMLSPRSKKHRWFREFRALEGVSFDVRQGETLGIVGRNGSGKSTLLQIICGTLSPSVGEVGVRGRIAALLELGAGFNPEFTGRENVYLNGTVLGLTRDEINEKFDEILDFAEIGEFIDQPVKSYSSGMYIRLATCPD
jgi:lipopolysaccharide transport system ATP-binding protein